MNGKGIQICVACTAVLTASYALRLRLPRRLRLPWPAAPAALILYWPTREASTKARQRRNVRRLPPLLQLGVKGEELPKVMYRLIEADHYIHKRILVVGGGDSAVEAAVGLAHQVGNSVTLSYRQSAFSRIKDRNAKRLEEFLRKGKITVLLNSKIVEVRSDSVVLEVSGQQKILSNDFIWIFAGGEPPTAFLNKIGVRVAERDMTRDGMQARMQAAKGKENLVPA